MTTSNPNIFFEITDRCNHECIFCGKRWRTDCGHTLSYEDLDTIISYEKNIGKISGGEPGLEKQKCFYYFEHETADLAINTNLTLWSTKDLAYMQSKDVYFIVDAPTTDVSEYRLITRQDTFDTFISNLRCTDPNRSTLAIVLNQVNIETIERSLCDFMSLGFKRFTITPMIPNGNAADFNYKKAMRVIERLYQTYRDVSIRTLGKTLKSIVPASHDCLSGKDMLVILSNGDVVPCAWNNEHILGNIRVDDYDTIKANGLLYRSSIQNDICQGFVENYKRYCYV